MKNETEQLRARIVRELKHIAFANGADYTGVTADTLAVLSKGRRAAVKEIGKSGVVLYDKFKAIEILGKRYGLFAADTASAKPTVTIADDISRLPTAQADGKDL
ncbi:hypothetical protein FACS1894133_7240 [Clostridia bacterium]|nr:hypothetical protein FACS1894133_7240 [Clostridia bacterium]